MPHNDSAHVSSSTLLATIFAVLLGVHPHADSVNATTSTTSDVNIASLTLTFEQNLGQTDGQVDFVARGSGYLVYLTEGDALLRLGHDESSYVVRMGLIGADETTQVAGQEELLSRSNYLVGSEDDWLTNIPNYTSVQYDDVYEGIDVRYYGNQRQLEYDFIVAAGADPGLITIGFDGTLEMSIAKNGDLVLALNEDGDDVRFQAPMAYQNSNDGREIVACRYVINDNSQVGFELGDYNANRELVIDPILDYGTYLGGTGTDQGIGIDVDGSGNVYVTGRTSSAAFPTTVGALDESQNGLADVFITKLSADGSSLVYSTFLGGSGIDVGEDIFVDTSGEVYVTGETQSSDFATSVGAFDTSIGGTGDAFVTKLNASGDTLIYSTYIGGNKGEVGYGIDVDASGNAFITGRTESSNQFPTTGGAHDATLGGSYDAFVTKLNAAGSALIYSTYLGGDTGVEYGHDISVDGSGNAYLIGYTQSTDFNTTASAFDASLDGTTDAFITKLNSTGTGLLYSTYLGGSGTEYGYGIALNGTDQVYVTGYTASADFSTTAGAYDETQNGGNDVFITRFETSQSGAASLVYSTLLGGSSADYGYDIAVDASGKAYTIGHTYSSDLPTTGDAHDTTLDGLRDASLATIDSTGSILVYSTYLGGAGSDQGNDIVLNSSGDIYVTGYTDASDFDATIGAFDVSSNGGQDGFVVKFATGVGNILIVDTTSDVSDGDTTSVAALLGNTGADGRISLREAIIATNNTPNGATPDEIHFNIPLADPNHLYYQDNGSAGFAVPVGTALDDASISDFDADYPSGTARSWYRIVATNALPPITDPVILDGRTQPGYAATQLPVIEIDGSGAGSTVSGLHVSAGGSTVRGLVIVGFDDNGILVDLGDGNTITGNFVGADVSGTVDAGNTNDGIDVKSDGNTIGGLTTEDRNLVSGNLDDGIQVSGDNNFVQGNFVGTDITGTLDVGNGESGVELFSGGNGNTVGGNSAAARNLISGNDFEGVFIKEVGTSNNVVAGNYIGTNASGTAVLPNNTDGVLIDTGASNNTIGGTAIASRNVISGNSGVGISIDGAATTGNIIQGNFIGTDASASSALGNTAQGIRVTAPNNTIGGASVGAGNTISGNTAGIRIDGINSTGNVVQGNFIGTNATGVVAIPNTDVGVLVNGGAVGNTIGGNTPSQRNLISGNAKSGVSIDAPGTTGNVVIGNYIGTDTTGISPLGNSDHGVELQNSAAGNRVGGTAVGEGNTVAFNGGDGVYVTGVSTDTNTIAGNSMFSNTGLGIDLAPDGVGVGGGANEDLTAPTVTGVTPSGPDYVVTGAVGGGNAVEFFRVNNASNPTVTADPAGSGEGFLYVVTASALVEGGVNDADATPGIFAFTIPNGSISAGDTLTATATDVFGNTSEFATGVIVGSANNPPAVAAAMPDTTVAEDNAPINDYRDLNDVFTDIEDGSALTFAVQSNSNPGLVTPTIDGADSTLDFTFAAALSGNASIVIRATDSGALSVNDTLVVTVTPTYDISGRVFEDAVITAGVGETFNGGEGDTGLAGARVELFDATDVFQFFATTDGSGNYVFANLDGGTTYKIRVVAATLDAGVGALPEQTFESDGSTDYGTFGTAMGGQDALVADTTGQSTMTGAENWVSVSVGVSDVTGVDFGFSYELVVNTNDTGQGSFRRFLDNANGMAGVQTSRFNIPTSDPNYTASPLVYVIQPLSPLPQITDPTIVDGTTQPDFPTTAIIVLDGAQAGVGTSGLRISSGGSTVRGLVIRQFTLNGIHVTTTGGNTIEGNYIGVDVTGLLDRGNGAHGIHIDSDTGGNAIGGVTVLERNVISGNGANGIFLQVSSTNIVQGNYIGADKNGVPNLGNGGHGILIQTGSGNAIGGTAPGAGNVISGNVGSGVAVTG